MFLDCGEKKNPNKINFLILQTEILLNTLTKVLDNIQQIQMNVEKWYMFQKNELIINVLKTDKPKLECQKAVFWVQIY